MLSHSLQVTIQRGVLCAGMSDMDMSFLRVIAEGDLVAVDYPTR
jgi:hypothetical protein